jgi:ZipA, C-terminal FtsZ-binding domain
MTDLQLSLMVIGGSIVVGVVSYNRWQEYKAKKSLERVFGSVHDDVLVKPEEAPTVNVSERQEPVFAQESVAVPVTVAPPVDAGAPTVPVAPSSPPPVYHQPVKNDLLVDDLIDCVISIGLTEPVHGAKILPMIQSLRHIGNKPVHFIGHRENAGWEPVVQEAIYTGLKAGMQLANRSNTLNELEYSELVTQLRYIADSIDAELEVPDMRIVMTSVRALHQFVTEYDAQLGINIYSNSAPWAVGTLLAALERQGFDLRQDGRLVMPDGDGGILFSLLTNVAPGEETTSRLTLLLNVPCVAVSRDGFGAMVACAKMLAARLDGTVIDDSVQPLSDEALLQISDQVKTFYNDMQAINIPAGSTRALRLFNS